MSQPQTASASSPPGGLPRDTGSARDAVAPLCPRGVGMLCWRGFLYCLVVGFFVCLFVFIVCVLWLVFSGVFWGFFKHKNKCVF